MKTADSRCWGTWAVLLVLIVGGASVRAGEPPPLPPGVAPMAPPKLATVEEIRELMKNFPTVKVAAAGTQVFLDGSVENQMVRERVEKVAHSFTNVIDLTTMVENADVNAVLAQEIQQRIGLTGVKVRIIKGNIVLDGDVASDADRKSAENVAKAYGDKVVNNLGLRRQMVEIDVSYMDVNFQKLMNIQHNPMTVLANPGVTIDPLTFVPAATYTHIPGIPANISRTWTATGTASTTWLLQWLESDTDNKVLDRPHVACLTGEKATFRQGGERGYQLIGLASADVKFKEFGLIINVLPNLTRDGRIQLDCSFEFSTPDPQGSNLDFLKYSTSSVTVLNDGESLIVSGLVQDVTNQVRRGIPFLRRIPLLGHFFDDHNNLKTKRDLLLVITPRLPTTFAAIGPSTSGEQAKRADPARVRWVEDLQQDREQLLWKNKDRAKAGVLVGAPAGGAAPVTPSTKEPAK